MKSHTLLTAATLTLIPALALVTAQSGGSDGEAAPALCGSHDDATSLYELDSEERVVFLDRSIGHRRRGVDEVREHVEALAPEERAALVEVAQNLVELCPYQSATVDLFTVLAAELRSIPQPGCAAHGEPEEGDVLAGTVMAQERLLSELRSAVDAHAALLGAFKVTRASQSPEDVAKSFGTVVARVQALPSLVTGRIQTDGEALAGATLGLWNDKLSLIRYGEELRTIAQRADQVIALSERNDDSVLVDAGTLARSQAISRVAHALDILIGKYLGLYC